MQWTRVLLWLGTGLLLAMVAWLGVVRFPRDPAGVQAGNAERMAEQAAFLEPVADTPPLGGGRSAGPVRDPFRAPLGEVTESVRPVPPPTGPRVSAILITGARRLAIVDDRVVRPGDELAGGVRVAEIQRDAVVLVARDGTRRVLRIERGEG